MVVVVTNELKAGPTTLLAVPSLAATAPIVLAMLELGNGRCTRFAYPHPGTNVLPGQPVGESAPNIVQP